MATRRGFLRIVGSSAVILVAGGATFSLTRDPKEARAPWALAGDGYEDPRLFALSYAILAPNPHNRQPWMVDLVGENEAILYCDPERLLPETDPFNRQITIGLGCFLELARIAATERGHSVEIVPFPEGEPETNLDARPIAHLKFSSSQASSDPLFQFARARRSNKEPFDKTKPVSVDTLGELVSETTGIRGGGTIDKLEIEELRTLTWNAYLIEMMTPRTLQESIDLMRIGKKAINRNPDGIDLGGAMLEAMNLSGILTHELLADPKSTAFKQGLDMYEAMLMSAMGYAWLITDDNSRAQQINAGRNWIRMNLKATSLGLAIHPLSQALQEYPEMSDHYTDIHGRLDATGDQTVQMLGRIGYGRKVAPSPRWKLETRLI